MKPNLLPVINSGSLHIKEINRMIKKCKILGYDGLEIQIFIPTPDKEEPSKHICDFNILCGPVKEKDLWKDTSNVNINET